MEYYSAIKKDENCVIFRNMKGPRDYHTKWSKLDRERQTGYCLHVEFWKKGYRWTYMQKRNSTTDIENKFLVSKGERGGSRDKLGVLD